MIPALMIIGFGRRRRLLLPLPFFILWPLILLALAGVVLAGWFVRLHRPKHCGLALAKAGFLALFGLSGLQIDVRSHDHHQLLLWFV